MTGKTEMTGMIRANYSLAICHACSLKILLDSCTVFLQFTKIKQTKERKTLLIGWG